MMKESIPSKRAREKEVMRVSGPRMIFYHPVMAIRHVIESRKEKKRLEKEGYETRKGA